MSSSTFARAPEALLELVDAADSLRQRVELLAHGRHRAGHARRYRGESAPPRPRRRPRQQILLTLVRHPRSFASGFRSDTSPDVRPRTVIAVAGRSARRARSPSRAPRRRRRRRSAGRSSIGTATAGWTPVREPRLVRVELAQPVPGREARRRVLLSFVQLSDFQLVDEESPARVELVDRYGGSLNAAYRPQEGLNPFVMEGRSAGAASPEPSRQPPPGARDRDGRQRRQHAAERDTLVHRRARRRRRAPELRDQPGGVPRSEPRPPVPGREAAGSTTTPTEAAAVRTGPATRRPGPRTDARSAVGTSSATTRPLRADEPSLPRDRPRAAVVFRLRQPRRARAGERAEQRPLRARGRRVREAGAALQRASTRSGVSSRAGSTTRSAHASCRFSLATSSRRSSARRSRAAAGDPCCAIRAVVCSRPEYLQLHFTTRGRPVGHGYLAADAARGSGTTRSRPGRASASSCSTPSPTAATRGTSTRRSTAGWTRSSAPPSLAVSSSSSSGTTRWRRSRSALRRTPRQRLLRRSPRADRVPAPPASLRRRAGRGAPAPPPDRAARPAGRRRVLGGRHLRPRRLAAAVAAARPRRQRGRNAFALRDDLRPCSSRRSRPSAGAARLAAEHPRGRVARLRRARARVQRPAGRQRPRRPRRPPRSPRRPQRRTAGPEPLSVRVR